MGALVVAEEQAEPVEEAIGQVEHPPVVQDGLPLLLDRLRARHRLPGALRRVLRILMRIISTTNNTRNNFHSNSNNMRLPGPPGNNSNRNSKNVVI